MNTEIQEVQLNTYQAYKDSGVEWLGEIPEHWEVKRLKFISKLISEKISSKESQLKYIGMENIESWTGEFISSDSETEGLAGSSLLNIGLVPIFDCFFQR